jgi:hypothetical protein
MNINKIFPLIVGAALTPCLLKAQLINNGATITIQNNASVIVMGELKNNTGVITNDGKLEVQGNFINTASYTSTAAEDSLILTGTGPDTLTSGGATINYLTVNKTAATDVIRLGANVTVAKKLDYTNGILTTDPILNPSFTLISPTTATYAFAANTEVVGNVRRTGWVNGTSVVFNQPNMQVSTTGGTAPTDLTVTMIPQTFGGDPSLAEREVKRKYSFAQTAGTGFTATVRYPFLVSELNTNTEANLVPWKIVSGEWNGFTTGATRDLVNHHVTYAAIPAADLTQEWKLADPKYTFNVTALIRGPWNGTAMNTSLNSGGILPLAQPYNVTPFNYTGTESVASIPNANIVDWVLVELRKPSTALPQDALSATIIGRKAGFLLNNGTVVDIDGITPMNFDITKQGAAFVTVRHRNHLGVLSNIVPSNAAGSFTNDFSVLANSYKVTGAASDPVVLLSGGVKYGLWAGDANKNGIINGTDISAIKVAISSLLTGYQLTDVNLTNTINGTDVGLSKSTISLLGTGSAPARNSVRIATTNIPDPIEENN